LLSCFSIEAYAGDYGELGDIAVPSINAPNMDVPASHLCAEHEYASAKSQAVGQAKEKL
jgi:hypothetical protein